MKTITYIEAKIISVSPLHIGDDEGNILIDNENNMAYLPATSIAGSFRSYLASIGENVNLLFGESEKSQISNIFIKDAFANIVGYDKRDGLKIDGETGSNVHGSKIERLYLSEGLEFNLNFKILLDSSNDKDLKPMIYKSLKALNKSLIRFGGHKSSGLGIFKVQSVMEWDYDLEDLDDLSKYLKGEEKEKLEIINKINEMDNQNQYVEFFMEGSLSTPLIIKAPKSFNPSKADDTSIKTSGGKYLIPGSSFKGILRSRVETIANHFGSLDKALELFGELNKDNILSRVFVKESIIDNSEYLKEIEYNRIKTDKFTSGVKYGSLMQDIPIMGNSNFHIIYRKMGDKKIDDYAIGILSLALRDLGTENLTIGGNSSIGRGRFKADMLSIESGKEKIKIDFNDKTISNKDLLSNYIKSVKSFKNEVMASD